MFANIRRYAFLTNQQQPSHATSISLPISTEGNNLHEEGDGECPICLSQFEQGDQIRMLPCSHAFHAECIDTWIVTNPTCSLCRCSVVLSGI
ncbi:hypothetical protein ACJIZ3_007762 [Penstemon smallii]|uniref:RING-type domain-containing protein n=1 Tax=Penstemon smallii TaxID=265156 RepID=A0ABD3T8V3_9LAMI